MYRLIRLAGRASRVRLIAVLIGLLVPLAATAGPNARAKLILHCNLNLAFTSDLHQSWDGYSELYDCKNAVTQVPAEGQGVIFFLLAAFDNFASPRIKAFSFGVNYTSPQVAPVSHGPSNGDPFMVPDDSWPASGSGIGVNWTDPLTRQVNELYWFACYSYAGNSFKVVGHPRLGAEFVDDAVPPVSDYVADNRRGGYYDANYFGMIGFGRKGNNPCVPDQSTGACCMRTGSCIVQTRAGCTYLGHAYLGDDTSCNPNPCEPGTGACCIRGECRQMQWDECLNGGGTFMGEGIACDPSPCGFGESQSSWGVLKNVLGH